MSLHPFTTALKHIPTPVAVACSGGLDSVALLHATCLATSAAGLQPMALHIDHGIHPNSAAWAAQVQATAAQFGSGFASERVIGLSGDMPSLENAARNARHAALKRLCEQHGIKTLLLAHHANDQAETVLLNLLRGTGLGGVGMPQSRLVGDTTWLRPWLHLPRASIEAYAAQHQLSWLEDPSNTDQTLRRNAVRHTLWPVVQAVESRALPSLSRFADIALEAANTEQTLAALCLQPHIRPAVHSTNTEHAAPNTRGKVLEDTSTHATKHTVCWQDGAGLDWYAASQHQPPAVQASLLRAWLAQLGCKPPTQARLAGMLAQLNARTGDGLRCTHEHWRFEYRGRVLFALRTSADCPEPA
jgi:tRNA(Ile)-lysidine synthase